MLTYARSTTFYISYCSGKPHKSYTKTLFCSLLYECISFPIPLPICKRIRHPVPYPHAPQARTTPNKTRSPPLEPILMFCPHAAPQFLEPVPAHVSGIKGKRPGGDPWLAHKPLSTAVIARPRRDANNPGSMAGGLA